MKTRLVLAFAAGLLLMTPIMGYAGIGRDAKETPPVAPTLVREGDFGVKLVETLKIAKAEDEALAEKKLADLGIAPKNGWISDYPVTPAVMGEIRDSVARAADTGKIAMKKDEALKALYELEASLGLPIEVAKEGVAKVTTTDYESSEAVDEYYDEEGPPVVTYYAPPWDYYYLYDYVPYPFFYTSFYFPGYFVLRSFTTPVVVINARAVIVAGRPVFPRGVPRVVSNVVVNPATGRASLINPFTRQLASPAPRTAPLSNTGASSNWTATNGQSAQSILGRGVQRGRTAAPLDSGVGRSVTAPAPMVRSGPARSFSTPSPVVRSEPARSFSAPAPMVRSGPARTFSAPVSRPSGAPRGGGFIGGRGGCMGPRC